MKILKAASIFLSIAFILLYFFPLAFFLAAPLTVRPPLKRAEAVVILPAGKQPLQGFNQQTLENLEHGFKLFQLGYGRKVILTGGAFQGEQTLAEAMANWAQSRGFAQSSLIIENIPRDPQGDIEQLARSLKARNFSSIILVVSPQESAVTKLRLERREIAVIPSPPPSTYLQKIRGREQLSMLMIIIREYLRYFLVKAGLWA